MTEKVHCFASRLAFCFFLILFFAAKICALLFTNMALPILVMLLSICALLYTLNRKYGFLQRVSSRITGVVAQVRPASAFAILLALHLAVRLLSIFIFQVDTTTGWDQQAYIPGTTELIEKGYLEQHAWYLYLAPHFFWYAHFLALPVSIFGESNIGILLYLALISTASSYFLGSTLLQQTNRATAYSFMLLYAVLPSTVLSTSHITHEHAFVFFLSLFIWLRWGLMPRISDRGMTQFLIEILAFASLIIATMVNGSGFIALTATVIIYLLTGRGKRIFLHAAKISLLLLMFIGARYAANDYHIAHSKCACLPDQTEQYKWVLYIGACSETAGHYLKKEHDCFFYSAPANASPKEIADYRRELLLHRYQDLTDHPKKLISLLSRKIMVIWGVFKHPYDIMREHSKRPFLHSSNNVSLFVKVLAYTEAMLALLAALYVVRYRKRPKNVFYEWCTLFLCGGTCMLLITEVSGKYTYSFQPFLYIFFLIPWFYAEQTQMRTTQQIDGNTTK